MLTYYMCCRTRIENQAEYIRSQNSKMAELEQKLIQVCMYVCMYVCSTYGYKSASGYTRPTKTKSYLSFCLAKRCLKLFYSSFVCIHLYSRRNF